MMNASVSFDTLAYAKKLITAGFTQQQAEVQAEALKEIIENELATKRDLKELELNFKKELDLKLKELELRLTIRMGAIVAAAVAILAAIIKFS